tara:strand:+ start:556 stop:951 length:396 start_codon:yes stop_codon:yes gene_type:complete
MKKQNTKYYLPIIEPKNVYISEVDPNDYENMLKLLYKKLQCNIVEKVNFNDKYDFIIDEEGTFKEHNLGYSLPNFPNKYFQNQPFFGKSTIVKIKENKEGEIYWTCFDDFKELSDVLIKYINKQRIYKKTD